MATTLVFMSLLMLSASPASAMPRLQSEFKNLELSIEELVRNPCSDRTDYRNTHRSPDFNFTLNILDLVKIFSGMSWRQATEIINETLPRGCHQQTFIELVEHNRASISKTADRKTAIEEMFRVLSTYTAHVIFVMKDSSRSTSDCQTSGEEYEPNRNSYLHDLIVSLLNTMCYTVNLENLLGLDLQFTYPSTDTLNDIINMERDCSQRQLGDCQVMKNAQDFLIHYRDYYQTLHDELQQRNGANHS